MGTYRSTRSSWPWAVPAYSGLIGRPNIFANGWSATFATGQYSNDGREAQIRVIYQEVVSRLEPFGSARDGVLAPASRGTGSAGLSSLGGSIANAIMGAVSIGAAKMSASWKQQSRALFRNGRWLSKAQQKWYEFGSFWGNQYTEKAKNILARSNDLLYKSRALSGIGLAVTTLEVYNAGRRGDWLHVGAAGVGATALTVAFATTSPVLAVSALAVGSAHALFGLHNVYRSARRLYEDSYID